MEDKSYIISGKGTEKDPEIHLIASYKEWEHIAMFDGFEGAVIRCFKPLLRWHY